MLSGNCDDHHHHDDYNDGSVDEYVCMYVVVCWAKIKENKNKKYPTINVTFECKQWQHYEKINNTPIDRLIFKEHKWKETGSVWHTESYSHPYIYYIDKMLKEIS